METPKEKLLLRDFFPLYLKYANIQVLDPQLLERWELCTPLFSGVEEYAHYFSRIKPDQQAKLASYFGIFPLPEFQARCLYYAIHQKNDIFLKELIKIWFQLPFDFSWNLLWIGLAFLEDVSVLLSFDTFCSMINERMDKKDELHEKYLPFGLSRDAMEQSFFALLSHHESTLQQTGIYGLGFFGFSNYWRELCEKLESAGKNRSKLIIHTLSKINVKGSCDQVYSWAKQLAYPDWETMEDMIWFFQQRGEEGRQWIEKLRKDDHPFWENYFKHSTL